MGDHREWDEMRMSGGEDEREETDRKMRTSGTEVRRTSFSLDMPGCLLVVSHRLRPSSLLSFHVLFCLVALSVHFISLFFFPPCFSSSVLSFSYTVYFCVFRRFRQLYFQVGT